MMHERIEEAAEEISDEERVRLFLFAMTVSRSLQTKTREGM